MKRHGLEDRRITCWQDDLAKATIGPVVRIDCAAMKVVVMNSVDATIFLKKRLRGRIFEMRSRNQTYII